MKFPIKAPRPGRAGMALPVRFAGFSCAAVFAASAMLWYSIDLWMASQVDLQLQQSRLRQARARDQQSLRQVEAANFARDFMAQAQKNKLVAGQWVGRGIDIREARAKRSAAVGFLYQAQSYRGQVFNAEEFDVAATNADAGLFGDVIQDFQVRIKGRSMFRVAQ